MVRAMKDRKLLKPSHSLRFLRAVIPYRLGLISSYRAMEIIVGMYRGATLEETLDHNTVLFNDYLKNDIRPDAVRELEMHRSRVEKPYSCQLQLILSVPELRSILKWMVSSARSWKS